MKLLRRILSLLIVTAYLGATVLQAVPACAGISSLSGSSTNAMHAQQGQADKTPCKEMSGIAHGQDGQADKMPCKGQLPNCMTDIGCIFLVSMPTPDLTLFTTTGWSSVIYHNASEALRGRSIKPALGPPIFLA